MILDNILPQQIKKKKFYRWRLSAKTFKANHFSFKFMNICNLLLTVQIFSCESIALEIKKNYGIPHVTRARLINLSKYIDSKFTSSF